MMSKTLFILATLLSVAYGYSGIATSYVRKGGDIDSTGGHACESTNPPAAYAHMFAAVPEAHWDGGANCGKCIKCTGAKGTAYAMIVDLCPERSGSGGCGARDVDFSEEAAYACTGEGWGESAIEWSIVSCPSGGGSSSDTDAEDAAAAKKAAAKKAAEQKAAAAAATKKAAEEKAAADAAASKKAAEEKAAADAAAAKKAAEDKLAAEAAAQLAVSQNATPEDLTAKEQAAVTQEAVEALGGQTVQAQTIVVVDTAPQLTEAEAAIVAAQATAALATADQTATTSPEAAPVAVRRLSRRMRL